MLIDLIHSAQKESQEEMVFLIQKFYKLLRKYGRKLDSVVNKQGAK